MDQYIVQCIAFFLDWVPYTVGRLSVFVFTFDFLHCERWRPIIWDTNIFGHRWTRRVNGELMVTQWGARWIGAVVMAISFVAMVFLVFWRVSKM
jgi:hypothetical protein